MQVGAGAGVCRGTVLEYWWNDGRMSSELRSVVVCTCRLCRCCVTLGSLSHKAGHHVHLEKETKARQHAYLHARVRCTHERNNGAGADVGIAMAP